MELISLKALRLRNDSLLETRDQVSMLTLESLWILVRIGLQSYQTGCNLEVFLHTGPSTWKLARSLRPMLLFQTAQLVTYLPHKHENPWAPCALRMASGSWDSSMVELQTEVSGVHWCSLSWTDSEVSGERLGKTRTFAPGFHMGTQTYTTHTHTDTQSQTFSLFLF